MVIVEFSYRDPETGQPVPSARLSVAAGFEPLIEGDSSIFNWEIPVPSERHGREITYLEDPEEWARGLVSAYASYGWACELLRDDAAESSS